MKLIDCLTQYVEAYSSTRKIEVLPLSNARKSCLTSTTHLKFLGFVIDSVEYYTELTDRDRKITDMLAKKLVTTKTSIKQILDNSKCE